MILFIAGLLGLISVALGAYADHGLQATASTADLKSIATALRYHQTHVVLLAALGLAQLASPKLAASRLITTASLMFIAAILLFSFSIYSAVIFEMPGLKNIVPIGGILFMLAWLTLALAGWQLSKKSQVN